MRRRRRDSATRTCAWITAVFLAGAIFAHATFVASAQSVYTVATASASGEELIRRHRCGACHLDLPQPTAARSVASTSARAVFELLRDPARHPNYRLSEGEAVALALAVAPGSARELARERRQLRTATPELGTLMVRGLGCGACHAGLPSDNAVGPVLSSVVAGSNAAWLHEFLRKPHAIRPFGTRPGSGARMPDFGLSAAEVDSVVAFLSRRASPARLTAALPATLTAHGAATADVLLDRLSCRGCHVYRGRGGRIGPELDRVRERRTSGYIASIIRDPAGTHAGAVMPRIADARVERVIALLAGGDPRDAAAPVVSSSRSPDLPLSRSPAYLSPLEHALVPLSGDVRYATWCAACHGASGRGDGYNRAFLTVAPAAHADSTVMSVRPDDTLYDGIAAGGASLGRSAEMPPFGATLSRADIRQLVAAVRALCRCTGPVWSRDGRR